MNILPILASITPNPMNPNSSVKLKIPALLWASILPLAAADPSELLVYPGADVDL